MEIEEYNDFICKSCGKKYIKPVNRFLYCPFCGSKQNADFKIIKLDDELNKKVYEWLSRRLEIDKNLVGEVIDTQMATVFLLMWPIIENTFFNSNMAHVQMKKFSKNISKKIYTEELNEIFIYFHDRYRDKRKYKNLRGEKDSWYMIDKIIEWPTNYVYDENKILFVLYVVYRYRNNIFHGIKTINQWNDFSYEIELCIRFMLLLDKVM